MAPGLSSWGVRQLGEKLWGTTYNPLHAAALVRRCLKDMNVREGLLKAIVAVTLMGTTAGCVTAGPNERVYFEFELSVGDTDLKNVHYTFGDELVNRLRPVALSMLPFQNYTAQMIIPENFDVSWETDDGKHHSVTVPVRSRLHESIYHKTLLFVLQKDSVEAYIAINTPAGQKREKQFYSLRCS